MQLESPTWTAVWTQAVTDISGSPEISDVTLRIQVRVAFTGTALRFVLSNRFGTKPLVIGEAAMVLARGSTPVFFDGGSSAEVPPGDELTCDAVATGALEAGLVTVHLYLPGRTALSTGNIAGAGWNLSDSGNHVGIGGDAPVVAPSIEGQDGVSFTAPTPFIRAVEIRADDIAATVVCLGDSITAAGWPNRASTALADARIVLLNRGIPGNRLSRAGSGPAGSFFGRSGIERFADDVLGSSGATHVVVAIGTNDLGHPGSFAAPLETPPSADELTEALDSLIIASQSAGTVPIIATISPFLGAAGYDADREQTRQQVNDWIRSSPRECAVLDFDRALRSPNDSSRLASQYDSGDHLHPNDKGQDRLAEVAASYFTRTAT